MTPLTPRRRRSELFQSLDHSHSVTLESTPDPSEIVREADSGPLLGVKNQGSLGDKQASPRKRAYNLESAVLNPAQGRQRLLKSSVEKVDQVEENSLARDGATFGYLMSPAPSETDNRGIVRQRYSKRQTAEDASSSTASFSIKRDFVDENRSGVEIDLADEQDQRSEHEGGAVSQGTDQVSLDEPALHNNEKGDHVESERATPPLFYDNDLASERWQLDPWGRPPGQLWTTEVQAELNLRALIKARGFTGSRATWLLNQCHRRKRSRLKYSDVIARKRETGQRNEEQSEECEEEWAIALCEYKLCLYSMIYGPKWPESANGESGISSDAGPSADLETSPIIPCKRRGANATSTKHRRTTRKESTGKAM